MAPIPEELFRFPLRDLALICGVTERTARRWLDGQTVTPHAAIVLLRALRDRDLGFLHPAWDRWVINDKGELCSPENWFVSPGDVRAMQLKEAQVSALRREAFELRQRLAEIQSGANLEDQPLPENWTIQATPSA